MTEEIGIDSFQMATYTAKPSARLFYSSGSQSINASTNTAVSLAAPTAVWSFDRWDTFAGANPTRLTIPETGVYIFGANVEWEANSTGTLRQLWVADDNARILGITLVPPHSASTTSKQSVAMSYVLEKGQYLEVIVRHDASGAINITQNSYFSPVLWAAWHSRA